MYEYTHPDLGHLLGQQVGEDLVQFRSLPYARVTTRFARSQPLKALPRVNDSVAFDAYSWGPSSIQRLDCLETDLKWNQLPAKSVEAQPQSEDCLRVTLTVPLAALKSGAKIPVLAFIHGGALAVASGERYYYDPTTLCAQALAAGKPLIFVSINYRLGALGFLHSPEAPDLLPPNNGLHDQLLAFQWIGTFIAGFGGDANNVTAIGQSAGAASLELHNSCPRHEALYRQSIVMSGSGSIIGVKSPQQHHADFCKMAEDLNIVVAGRSARDIAQDLIALPVEKIRDLALHGAFCSESELIADKDWATMHHASTFKPNTWLRSQIVSSCTYDGSISYLVEHAKGRTQRAKIFAAICDMRLKEPQQLLDIYNISEADTDDQMLEKIGQVVTDAGFYAPALSMISGATGTSTESYLVLFDIPNPWPGTLPQYKCASHTWDIVSLLGAYDDQLPDDMRAGVKAWRQYIVNYCYGNNPGTAWQPEKRYIQRVTSQGLEELGPEEVASLRAERLLDLARKEGGEHGFDLMWENTVRFYLDAKQAQMAEQDGLDALRC